MLTDGVSSRNPEAKGKELRKLGIDILAIGIGNISDKDQLNAIAGENNVHLASHFDDLASKEFVQNMKKVTCQTGM